MFIARWHIKAKFGHQGEVLALLHEWDEQVGAQTNIDTSQGRYATGHIGTAESEIQMDVPIENLAALDAFWETIASVDIHKDWGRRMSEVVVSGSSYWEVLRLH